MRAAALGSGWMCAWAAVASLGCAAHVGPSLRSALRTDLGEFVFEYREGDGGAASQLAEAVRNASPKLARWGRLAEPVKVHVLPSHRALEEAVDRRGHRWLKAWARYDEVFVQSPRTWGLFGAPQREVDELMLHELTHSLMYQQAANRTHWRRKGIPPWFREGMASFTADQELRWRSMEELARFYSANPTAPVGDPEALGVGLAYAGAHHAFNFLVRRYGVARVQSLLGSMKQGRSFDDAFEEVVGLRHRAFLDDFRRYLRLRGFRG